ncbi:MAG: hypothetical protein R3D03_14485 [Geminicoccaceae bacterium]
MSGLAVLGLMGEAPKLTTEEALALARHVIRRVEDGCPWWWAPPRRVSPPWPSSAGRRSRGRPH